jgi:hypothetical protein
MIISANESKLSKQVVEAKLDPRTKRMRSKKCQERKSTKKKPPSNAKLHPTAHS